VLIKCSAVRRLPFICPLFIYTLPLSLDCTSHPSTQDFFLYSNSSDVGSSSGPTVYFLYKEYLLTTDIKPVQHIFQDFRTQTVSHHPISLYTIWFLSHSCISLLIKMQFYFETISQNMCSPMIATI
jgi:hypothetical protein